MAEASLLFGILSASPLPTSGPSSESDSDVFGSSSTSTIETTPSSTTSHNTLDAPDIPPRINSTMISELTKALSSTSVTMDTNTTMPSGLVSTKATTNIFAHTGYTDKESITIAVAYTCGGFAILLITAIFFAVRTALRKDKSQRRENQTRSPVVPPNTTAWSLLSAKNWGIPRPQLRDFKNV